MKKHYILLVILALAIAVIGCKKEYGSDPAPIPTSTDIVQAEVTSIPEPTVTPLPTATPTPEPTPTPLPSVQEVFTQTKYSGVYKTDVLFRKDFTSCDINMVGETPILIGASDDGCTRIFSIDPIKNIYRVIIFNDNYEAFTFVRINDTMFAVRDYEKPYLTVYDVGLNELGRIKLEDEYTNALVDKDGEHYWSISEGSLCKYDSEGREVERFDYDEDQIGAYIEDYNERRFVTVECFDETDAGYESVVYDVVNSKRLTTDGRVARYYVSPDESETLMICSTDDLFVGLFDGGIEDCYVVSQAAVTADEETADEATEEVAEIILAEPKLQIQLSSINEAYLTFVDWENRVLITSATYYNASNTVFEIKAYSIDTGEEIAQYATGMGSNYIWPALSLDTTRNLIFFTEGTGSRFGVYVWDYMNDTADDSADAFSKMSAIPDYIEEKRAAFEEKYNIRLYLGSEVFASPFDYRLTICKDWDKVEEGIDTFEEVFSNYPEGFFDQLKVDDIKTLGIYLCAGFEKIYSYSADDAIALACVFGYERALAVDLEYQYCLDRTIIHEVSHWIDGKIDSAKTFGKCKNYEDDWNELLPPDFSYKYSYVSGRTNWKYIYSKYDLENSYYCDEYSETYPGEDRARSFEYLMYGEESGYFYMDAPHIQKKLELYFRYIREAFDDSDWPEKTAWEEKLDYYINDWPSKSDDEEAEPAA